MNAKRKRGIRKGENEKEAGILCCLEIKQIKVARQRWSKRSKG